MGFTPSRLATAITVVLMVAMSGSTSGWARSVAGDDKECADTANAESAITACTRLYENRGLGLKNRAIALGNRGAAHKMLGRYDDAVADFDLAIDLDPKNPQYYCQRGDIRVRQNKTAEAIEDYTAALEKSPKYLWAFQGRGQAYLAEGKGDLAVADLNEALRIKPGAFKLLVLRGRAHNYAKNYDAAVTDLTKALADKQQKNLLPKERATIFSQRAFAYVKLKRASEAKTDIDEALKLAPKVAFSLGVAGLIEEELGNKSGAKDQFTRALEIEPNLVLAKQGLDRVGQTASASTDTSEPPKSKTTEAKPEPKADDESSTSDAGPEMCAKYIPEIGRTVKVQCDE